MLTTMRSVTSRAAVTAVAAGVFAATIPLGAAAAAPGRPAAHAAADQTAVTASTSNPKLRFGMTNPSVKLVQRYLGVPQTGWFGPMTKTAVMAFQKANGIAPSGVVGSATWAALKRPKTIAVPSTSTQRRQARIAVLYALAQVGKKYVWGAAGPDAFDCSGLTMASWAKAGVSFDHFSGLQYSELTKVSRSQIKPGDLLFFYSVDEHVGMYIGGGQFVHASNPRRGIRIDSLDSDWYSRNFVAAVRPGV